MEEKLLYKIHVTGYVQGVGFLILRFIIRSSGSNTEISGN